jgi:hypothetical protein
MNPGDVFHDRAFVYPDGVIDQKFCVVLFSGDSVVLSAKTTSQSRHYPDASTGCNSHRNVFLIVPPSVPFFKKDTFVQITEIRQYDKREMLQLCFDKQVEHVGALPQRQYELLRDCLKRCRLDIDSDFQKLLF